MPCTVRNQEPTRGWTQQVAARRMRHLLDPDRCEVTSRPPWRRIACDYEVAVDLLPGVRRTLAFRIDVEQPYVLPRD